MNCVGVTVTTRVLAVSLMLTASMAMPPSAGAQTPSAETPAPSTPAAKPAPHQAKPKPATEAAKPTGEVAELNLKSEPPGATARVESGQSCTTPCVLKLPMVDTSVTFTLAGYSPQVIPIKWLPATFHYEMYERTDQGIAVYPVDFSPNPAVAQLVANGKPKTAAAPAKKKSAAKPDDAAPPQ
jgi:hypothetical protein